MTWKNRLAYVLVALGPLMLGVVALSVGFQHLLVLEPARAVVVGDLRPGGCHPEGGCWALADAVFVTDTGEEVTVEVEVPRNAHPGHEVDLYYNPSDPPSATQTTRPAGWFLVGMGIVVLSLGAWLILHRSNQCARAGWKLLGVVTFVVAGFIAWLAFFLLLIELDLTALAVGTLLVCIPPLVVFPLAQYPSIGVREELDRVIAPLRDQRASLLWIAMGGWLLILVVVVAFLGNLAN